MNDIDRAKLNAIKNTLELIPVNGKENLDRMLGCIMMIEGMMVAPNEEVNADGE